jgi:DNA polymerase-3 subunit alpha
MAKFAGYGFNKSHSACYAVVSYQTAYLKANFPLEFMTALLNSEIGDETKIAQYIDEAEQLNIWVLPPDIHESDEGFSIVGNDIVFGLAAVKNVGHGAIQAIIEARREGPFESLHDFCQRVDLRFVNRKVVESLIKAGAFDCFERPRSQLFAMLDEAMEQGARIQKLQAEGQLSIFSKTDRLIPPVNPEIIASIPEWPETRLLAFEKEMLGVYRTGHPLENSAHTLSCYVNAWSSEIMELSENDQYWFGGLLVNLKKVSTRKGEKMAVGELEDLKGRIEVVFFPQTYESSSSILKSNNIIFVKGRPDRGAEKAKIIVSDVATLNTIGEKNLKSLLVEISVTAPRETLEELKKTFQKFRGQSKVYLKVATGTHGWIKMALPKYSVSLEPGLFDHLKDLVPPESIQVV